MIGFILAKQRIADMVKVRDVHVCYILYVSKCYSFIVSFYEVINIFRYEETRVPLYVWRVLFLYVMYILQQTFVFEEGADNVYLHIVSTVVGDATVSRGYAEHLHAAVDYSVEV